MEFDEEFVKNFWSKVDIKGDDECWEWKGALKHGYGSFIYKKKVYAAHRTAYQIYFDTEYIDPIIKCCHRCDRKNCVNPNHIFTGSQKDNVLDMEKKGRSKHPKGEENGMAKVSEKDVLEIRRIYANGNISQKELGRIFKLKDSMIGRITSGKNWKNVGGIITPCKTKTNHRLNEKEVRDIKILLKENKTSRYISEIYKISMFTVNMINNKKIWKNVEI